MQLFTLSALWIFLKFYWMKDAAKKYRNNTDIFEKSGAVLAQAGTIS